MSLNTRNSGDRQWASDEIQTVQKVKTELLIHVRSRKYHPQNIGREERYHGSLQLEHLYRVLPDHRTQLKARAEVEKSKTAKRFYLRKSAEA